MLPGAIKSRKSKMLAQMATSEQAVSVKRSLSSYRHEILATDRRCLMDKIGLQHSSRKSAGGNWTLRYVTDSESLTGDDTCDRRGLHCLLFAVM